MMMRMKVWKIAGSAAFLALLILLADLLFTRFEPFIKRGDPMNSPSESWGYIEYVYYAGKSAGMALLFILCAGLFFSLVIFLTSFIIRGSFFRHEPVEKGFSFSLALLLIALVISPINYYLLPSVFSPISMTVNILLFLSVFPLALLIYRGINQYGEAAGRVKRGFLFLCLLCLLSLTFLSFIMGDPLTRQAAPLNHQDRLHDPPHIILITLDALRADHLSCYGYTKISTRHIDQLAEDGYLFAQLSAPASWTTPSMMSMLTGQYPSVHGCTDLAHSAAKGVLSIAQILQSYGYRTSAIVANETLSHQFGFSRGFDQYMEYGDLEIIKGFKSTRIYYLVKRFKSILLGGGQGYGGLGVMENTTEWTAHQVRSFLNDRHDGPFFLWIHFLDPHGPFQPPKKYIPGGYEPGDISWRYLQKQNRKYDYREGDRKSVLNLYDGEILYVDEKLGEIFSLVKKKDWYDNALIILSSDHGEEFWENGVLGHLYTLYNEVLHIPMILKLPRQLTTPSSSNRIIPLPASLTYLPRTILDVLGIDGFEQFGPVSLLGIIKGEIRSQSPVFSEITVRNPALKKIRTTDFSLIYDFKSDKRELYHLLDDPDEVREVSDQYPEQTKDLSDTLINWVKQMQIDKKQYGEAKSIGMDQGTVERLRALGYLD